MIEDPTHKLGRPENLALTQTNVVAFMGNFEKTPKLNLTYKRIFLKNRRQNSLKKIGMFCLREKWII